MKTYCVAGPGKLLKELSERATWHYVHKRRAVLVFKDTDEPPPEDNVVKVGPGHQGKACMLWARQNVIEELLQAHAECTFTARQRQRAVERWARANKALARAQQAVVDAT